MPTKPIDYTPHVARKTYTCDTRTCDRTIRVGDPYTQISYPPGRAPGKQPYWTTARVCTACQPPAMGLLPADVRLPCTVGTADHQCELALDHQGPCQYPLGLF